MTADPTHSISSYLLNQQLSLGEDFDGWQCAFSSCCLLYPEVAEMESWVMWHDIWGDSNQRKSWGETISRESPSVHIIVHDEEAFDIRPATFPFSLLLRISSCLPVS